MTRQTRRRRARKDPPPVGISATERGAVVVKFPDPPADQILDELKAAGFRFNRRMIAWVHKGTDENLELAKQLWTVHVQLGGSDE
jgi:hypothetical protein